MQNIDRYFDEQMKGLLINTTNAIEQELRTNKQYVEARAAYERIWNAIESSLPEDRKHLMDELFEAEGSISDLYNEALFAKAVHFGMRLFQYLRMAELPLQQQERV